MQTYLACLLAHEHAGGAADHDCRPPSPPVTAAAAAAASPIQPFWINESDSILFYKLTKTACLLGVASGQGFLIARLPSAHPTLVRWSAPCFVKIRWAE